jgi:hypothetical protein
MLIQCQPTWRPLPQQQHRWKYSGCDCCANSCECALLGVGTTFTATLSGVSQSGTICGNPALDECPLMNFAYCFEGLGVAGSDGCCVWVATGDNTGSCFVTSLRLKQIADAVVMHTIGLVSNLNDSSLVNCDTLLADIPWGNTGYRPGAAWAYSGALKCTEAQTMDFTLVYDETGNFPVQGINRCVGWPGTVTVTVGDGSC